jgi:hypothetical protein
MSYTETETVTGDATVYHNDEMVLAEYTATIEVDVQIGHGGGRYINGVRVTFDAIEIDGVDIWDDEIENQLLDDVTREYDRCHVDLV